MLTLGIAWLIPSTRASGHQLADCGEDYAPEPYDDAACDEAVVDCWYQYPEHFLPGIIFCNVYTATDTGGGTLYGVTDYQGIGATSHSFWGTTGAGDPFCCVYEDTESGDLRDIFVSGTEFDDTISFAYGVDGFGTPEGAIDLDVFANGGEDVLVTSASNEGDLRVRSVITCIIPTLD